MLKNKAMAYKNRNEAIKALMSAMMKLDRLQVELSEDTPYPTPDAKQARERILATFDELESVSKFISELKIGE